jgi:hypothetical protein
MSNKSIPDTLPLLTSKQMAQFVTDGYLRFDGIVPDEINQRAVEDFQAERVPRSIVGGTPLSDVVGENGVWSNGIAVNDVFRLPVVQGIIRSLVGPGSLYDHHAVHTVGANNAQGQIWHADAIIDRRTHFDIQFFYFAHDTPREMGGTMILPGSHYRAINETDIARYQNIRGQLPMVCKAGTLVVVHHGIWHCAQPNRTTDTRYMFKLRLNPTVRQENLWDTSDVDDPEVAGILGSGNHIWYGSEVRLEIVNRIKLWRFLTGDDQFDVSYWLSRIENMPEQRVA